VVENLMFHSYIDQKCSCNFIIEIEIVGHLILAQNNSFLHFEPTKTIQTNAEK